MFLLSKTDKLYAAFRDEAFTEGALDIKTKYLVALACAVMADCGNCIKSYYKKAVEAGASSDQISEMLAITMSINAGSKKAKYSDLIAELERELN
jgi:AhpD family alkylhydroperoxidase